MYRFIFSFYVQFLWWFIIIWWCLISIKVLSCVPIPIIQTNISIFLPKCGVSLLQTHLDSLCLCTTIEAHKKDAMTNLASLLWLSKNVTSAEKSSASTFTLKNKIKCWGLFKYVFKQNPPLEHYELSLLKNLNRKKSLITCHMWICAQLCVAKQDKKDRIMQRVWSK